ncbi:hypothetical protein [Agarivorans sp. Z349TD_7]|uniref:hypothetical protein n=1 Tax=Agarivorans sp. Z349TD_7 TaxID=3421431 RepID=UPI003D7E3D77
MILEFISSQFSQFSGLSTICLLLLVILLYIQRQLSRRSMKEQFAGLKLQLEQTSAQLVTTGQALEDATISLHQQQLKNAACENELHHLRELSEAISS